ncbi:MAG: SPOR domain-containing protein [Gammaproteobacteria bacterium]|jgi:hypothetical protein|nr:SPOR domain-containing protein [Gammaproteobacteria bacterium]
MPARALIVLLVILNLGLATWWLLRPAPPAPMPWSQPEGVPRLRLLGEGPPVPAGADASAAPADAPMDPPGTGEGTVIAAPGDGTSGDAPAPSPASALRCTSFGPYPDAAAVARARTALQPFAPAHVRVRDEVEAPRGWRVVIEPRPDRAAADALALRIREAGFDDLLVVASGEDANGIALGRYGSESSARRREASLREAGFPALAQPIGGATSHWLDLAAGPGFDAAAAARATEAGQALAVDCAGIVDAPGAR